MPCWRREDVDYIESFDFFGSDWIKTGIKEERLIYRHWFNERKRKWLFYASMELQKRLGLARKVPDGPADADRQPVVVPAPPHGRGGAGFRRAPPRCDAVLPHHLDSGRDLLPDPGRAIWCPRREIRSRTLTFLMFTDYGMPVTFYNDHYDLLLAQDFLFARKISPDAMRAEGAAGRALCRDRARSFTISDEGRRPVRVPDRARPRWGAALPRGSGRPETSLGRDRTLMMVTCKKWHVAKRLVDRVRGVTGLPAVDYLFNEEATALPDLGGIQTTLEKRTRHRRALVRMLFEYWQTDRLILCVDPGQHRADPGFLQRPRAGCGCWRSTASSPMTIWSATPAGSVWRATHTPQ